jgi:phosphohistidine phosphatase
MRLFLMRHGIAADIGGEITSDSLRPLTAEGRSKTEQAAAGLLRIEPRIDLIATSPLLRARQTAEIVLGAYRAIANPTMEPWPELEYADPADVVARLRRVTAERVLLVGHEPGFSRLAAQLLTGSPTGFNLEFKKAAVCALEIEPDGDNKSAIMLWHATPAQLRLMGQ